MVISCVILVASKSILTFFKHNREQFILLPQTISRKLPRDLLLEAYFIHTLAQVEENNELWIRLEVWRQLLVKSEFENLTFVAIGDPQVRTVTNNLQAILQGVTQDYDAMMKDYQVYHLKTAGML
jgi:hypothetical protein